MQPLDGLIELVNIFGCRQDTQLGEQFRRRFPSGQQKKISLEKAWAYKTRYKKGF